MKRRPVLLVMLSAAALAVAPIAFAHPPNDHTHVCVIKGGTSKYCDMEYSYAGGGSNGTNLRCQAIYTKTCDYQGSEGQDLCGDPNNPDDRGKPPFTNTLDRCAVVSDPVDPDPQTKPVPECGSNRHKHHGLDCHRESVHHYGHGDNPLDVHKYPGNSCDGHEVNLGNKCVPESVCGVGSGTFRHHDGDERTTYTRLASVARSSVGMLNGIDGYCECPAGERWHTESTGSNTAALSCTDEWFRCGVVRGKQQHAHDDLFCHDEDENHCAAGEHEHDGRDCHAEGDSHASISVRSRDIDEGIGAQIIFIALSEALNERVTFTYSITDGTAVKGNDYDYTHTLEGSIAAGNTSTSFSVQVIDDSEVEGDETFEVELLTATTDSDITVPFGDAIGTITIVDNDSATLSIADADAAEDDGTMTFTMTLSEAIGQQFTVAFETSDGTATAGTDYTAHTGTRQFGGTDTTYTYDVDILNDSLTEGDETFDVTISASYTDGDGNVVILATDATATGTIRDDEAAPGDPTVSIGADVDADEEQTHNMDFALTLSEQVLAETVDVAFTVTDGEAVAGDDYSVVTSSPVSFSTGQTSALIQISPIDDSAQEGLETFTVTLTGATGRTSSDSYAITEATARGTIIDDEGGNVFVYISSEDPIFYEDHSLTDTDFKVKTFSSDQPACPISESVVVAFSTEGGTASLVDDVVEPSGTSVTISQCQTSSVSLGFSAVNDSDVEDDEYFTVALTSATGSPSGDSYYTSYSAITGTVIDNDNPDDSDGDGYDNDLDNCPDDANPDQEDADGDGIGDECDSHPDLHNDLLKALKFNNLVLNNDVHRTTAWAPSGWTLNPSDLSAGDSWRMLFISANSTAGKVSRSSSNIADYNTFIQGYVTSNGHADLSEYAGGFRAMGCTTSTHARANTNTRTGDAVQYPTYWLGGARLADDHNDLYDGTWVSEAREQEAKDADGSSRNVSQLSATSVGAAPFTGCGHDGTKSTVGALGQGNGTIVGGPGVPSDGNLTRSPFAMRYPNNSSWVAQMGSRSMYGVSELFTVQDGTTFTPGRWEGTEPVDGTGEYAIFKSNVQTDLFSEALAAPSNTGTVSTGFVVLSLTDADGTAVECDALEAEADPTVRTWADSNKIKVEWLTGDWIQYAFVEAGPIGGYQCSVQVARSSDINVVHSTGLDEDAAFPSGPVTVTFEFPE